MGFSIGKTLGKIAKVAVPAIGGGLLGGPVGAIVGGGIGSALLASEGQEQANAANIQSAREQMAFQERMSNTAHQREVTDLKAAGLNPVLSANAGAGTPTGALAISGNEAPDFSKVIGTALQARQMQQDFREIESRIGLNAAAKEREIQNAKAAQSSAKEAEARAKLHTAEAEMEQRDNRYLEENPKYYQTKKVFELLSPLAETARDTAVMYRSIKGFGGKNISPRGRDIPLDIGGK